VAINKAVIIGLGQLGRVFAGGLLRVGCSVVPLNRNDDMAALARVHPNPERVLVAVGENDLHTVLGNLPDVWKSRIALIQNELLPRDWQAHGLVNPTVISVWFEKKKGIDAKPLIASPVAGPGADLLLRALAPSTCPRAKSPRALRCCSNWCARTSTSLPPISPVSEPAAQSPTCGRYTKVLRAWWRTR